jgi:malate permease and related proteins
VKELLGIAEIVLPVFLVIGLGFLLGRRRFVTPEVNTSLSRLVFYIAAPALLFRSVARAPLSETVHLDAIGVIIGITIVFVAVIYFVSARLDPARRGVVTQGAHRSNMVFVGLPLVMNAFGPEALAPAAVMIGFLVVAYNIIAVMVLVLPHAGEEGQGTAARVWWNTGVKMARNPLILSCGAGLAWSAAELSLPVVLDRSVELVGRVALPLALISVGVSLDLRRLHSEFGVTALVALAKLVIYPAAIFAGLHLLGERGDDLYIPVLIMASPTAVVSFIMAQEMRGDENLAGSIVIGTTIGSLITISGWLVLIRVAGGG